MRPNPKTFIAMLITYTEKEVLEQLRLSAGLPVYATEPNEELADTTDKELLARFRLEYYHALNTAPLEELPVTEAGWKMQGRYTGTCRVEFEVPDSVARIVSLKMNEWEESVREVHPAVGSLYLRQQHSKVRATPRRPLMFRHADRLIVCGVLPGKPGGKVLAESLRVVEPAADGSFTLSPALMQYAIDNAAGGRVPCAGK